MKLIALIILSLAIIQVGATEYPYSPYSLPTEPETIPPFETDVSLQLITTNQDPDNPQPVIIPAAVCVGVGVGIIGWIGIKLWSACLDIQMRNATNKAIMEFAAAGAPITSPIPIPTNPVTSGCSCPPQPTAQPMPLLLEHSNDGKSWASISVGMTTGEQSFVPDTGTWRITPMRIIATRDGIIVPPGTLETSVDLRTWNVLSVSSSGQTITPEPNHFYRIR